MTIWRVILFGYNALDELSSLTDGLSHTTTWGFNKCDWLTSETNALGTAAKTYAYDADGRRTNRTMVGTTTSYTYDAVGNRTSTIYPQLTVSNQYNAINELTNMTDGVGTNKFTYTGTGQLQSETDLWASNAGSNTVGYAYNQGHRAGLSLTQPSASTWMQTYAYDSEWRMTNTTSPAGLFNYTYTAASPASALISGINLPNGASINNAYDSLGRLTSTALANQFGHVLDGCVYSLDLLGLRTNMTRNLGLTTNSVAIGYDGIDEITSWSGKEANGTLRHNEQLAYAYDAAGNLQTRTNDALVQTFNVDALNQISNVTRTGPLTVTGATPVPATNLTVNGVNAQTNGDFTFADGSNTLANGANTFTIIAKNPYGVTVTNAFTLNLPATVTCQYDANGNLTNDGTRIFSYDAENQLTNVFATNAWRVGFVYDGMKRRRITRDYTWSGAWVETNEIHYIYDGMLVLQERYTNNNSLVTYTRGLDFCLSLQGAGGIGGLLARVDSNGPAYYHADGSGNITALMDAYQNIVARYRYDAFGKLLGRWGVLADINTYRFSSKDYERVSGLYYYGFRFYEPNFQRWLNQDPLGLGGGPNGYTFAGNGPGIFFDPYGQYTFSELLQISGAFFQGAGQGAKNVGNATYNIVAAPAQLAGTLSTDYGREQVADALAGAVISGESFVIDPCARQQDLNNLAKQLNTLLNDPDKLSKALANIGVLTATLGFGGVASGVEEVDVLADVEAAEGTGIAATDTGPASSAINGAMLRQQLAAEEAAGAQMPQSLTGYLPNNNYHGLDQAISRPGGGVSPQAILDAWQNPVNVTGQSNGRFLMEGQNATIVVNSQGQIITTWANNSVGLRIVP